MPATAAPPAPPVIERRARGRGHRGSAAALCLGPVLTVLMALLPLVFNRDFYFYADTPEGAYGQWYELGEQILQGNWPLMNPAAWMAGNYVAEGQWGLWNPMVLLIALFVHAAPNAVFASTVIKLVLLAIGSMGVHLLTRDLGASPVWSLVAAVAAPLAGFTLFMDATSWVTNLMVWVFFPWTLWGIRRWVSGRGLFLWPAITGYLLITVGYVQGTVMLVLLYVALLVTEAVRRDLRAAGRTFVIGVVHGLIALAVFLPGVLTSGVTSRADETANDSFMVLTLSGLATGTSGFSSGDLLGWWGRYADLPLLYIAWFLPLVVLASGRRLRVMAPRLVSLWVFGFLVLALATGPSEMGPLRFPVRSLPWIALVLIISAVVILDRCLRRRPGAASLIVMLCWMGYSAWLIFAAVPERWHWPRAGSHLALMTIGFVLVWLLLRRSPRPRPGSVLRSAAFSIPVVVLLVGLAVSALQIRTYAPLLTSRSDYPASVDVYEDAVPDARGDGIVVGDALSLPQDFWQETIFGNSWYLVQDASFQNVYTPVGYDAYSVDTCMLFDGRTCPDLADRLFSRDETTGAVLADLLSLDTVQLLVDEDHPIEALTSREPPEGWHVAEVGEQSVTWVRDVETPAAGSVVWASPGTIVTAGADSDLSSTVHVETVGPQGGQVVFSRLDWPGYTVSGGTLSEDPVRGYLLTVDVPADAAGTDIVVTFRPPGWRIVQASMVTAGLLTLAVTGGQLMLRHRRSRMAR